MTFLPDLNVWLALTVEKHAHSPEAWGWFASLSSNARVVFCRQTQMGLLRLLTKKAVMGQEVLTVDGALGAYERWLEDPRVSFAGESPECGEAFQSALRSKSSDPESNWIADAYLFAFAASHGARLVTFDRTLAEFGRRGRTPIVLLG